MERFVLGMRGSRGEELWASVTSEGLTWHVELCYLLTHRFSPPLEG